MGVAQAYLAAYNAAQLTAWTLVCARCVAALAQPEPSAAVASFSAARAVVSVCQTLTLLETLHALVGLTRSGVIGNVAQWAGRTHCWWLVTQLPELQSSPAVVLLLLCWSLSDVVRYAWATLSSLGCCPAALTTLRYTAFIPLYPLGAGAEVALQWQALPAATAGFGRVTMPNAWNASFDYARFLFVVLLAYPLLWAQLYSHMFRQRRAKLRAKQS